MSHNEHPNATLGDFSIDPAMSQTQLHISPVQHHSVFPYDHASPSMSPYPFSPQQAPPGADPYRNSTAGPHSSTQAVNLPPIRSIESHPQPLPQHSPSPSSAVSNPYATSLGQPNPIPSYGPQISQMSSYYPPPMGGSYAQPMVGGPMTMSVASSPQGLRYPIPPGDHNKMLSGGRHKKEVKRRTKTGCLTCRRRRIKCDEAQPTCRNCQKSKRDCAGYDPIFKPQPGHSSIQPAPKLAQPASPASTQSHITSSLTQAQSHSQSHSATTDSPRSSFSQPDAMPSQPPDQSLNPAPYSYGSSIEAAFPPPGITSFPSSSNTPGAKPSLIPIVKRLVLEDMHNLDGLSPKLDIDTHLQGKDHDRICAHYMQHYAPHLDRFFEARFWQSEAIFQQADGNGYVMRQYKNFLSRLADQGSSKQAAMLTEETKLIWALLRLCHVPTTTTNGAQWIPQTDEAQRRSYLVQRIRVLEALLTGEYLGANPLSPPNQTIPNTGISNQLKQREMEFWFCIGQVVSTRETDASSARQLDESLARCRMVLNSFEQRDVIYSIAIIRHVGRRWGGVMQPGPGMADAKKDFDVATNFIRKEAVQGTNPIIQRICSMATKIWS